MFKNLFKLDYKRTKLEALGFYLAYFLFGIILAGMLSGISLILCNVKTYENSISIGRQAGQIVAIIYTFLFAFLIVKAKLIYTKISAILLVLTTIFLTLLGGCLLGCIPLSILTTFPKLNNEEVQEQE